MPSVPSPAAPLPYTRRHALFPESKALTRFETKAPLLIVGSHDWNVPNAFGQVPPCVLGLVRRCC